MLLDINKLNNKYKLNINGVVHVGAHFGEEHSVYESININKIVYFEPIKKTFEVLKKRVTNCEVHNVALGNFEGYIEMFVEDLDKYGCSSILEPSKNYDGYATFSKKETVKVDKLDNFKLIGYNFLNIDVQGYELEVLKGSHKTLNNIDYILCEVHRKHNEKGLDYHNVPLIEDITELLSEYGFKMVDVNWAGTSWGDAFYIKNK